MGAGHDTVAAELVRRARGRGGDAVVVDVLTLLPYGLGGALRHFYRGSVRHFPWAYAALYRLFLRPGPGRRPGGTPLARLAGDRLSRLAERTGADVVVPVFHLGAQLTGHLRARGRLAVPAVVFVLDFVAHRQWLHPGNDRYLCLTGEAARAARRSTGVPALACGPVADPAFHGEAPGAAGWRRRFARHGPGRPPVVLATGAWGVASHLDTTVRLLAGHGWLPVVLCGADERLRRALSRVPGVLALGWVTDMPGLLHAARVLVDNAAGQTAVQALAAGLPVVGHRPIPGHGADGVRAMAALGVSESAADDAELLAALRRLTPDGPARRERIAAGRALFRDDPVDLALDLALSPERRSRRRPSRGPDEGSPAGYPPAVRAPVREDRARRQTVRVDEFLAQVLDRGEYHSQEEAEQVTEAVLWVLASRIAPEEAGDLAAGLPAPLDDALRTERGRRPEPFDREEFLRRVAGRTGARPRTAEWDASAVLSTVADAVSEGQVGHLLEQLPPDWADLFGRTGETTTGRQA